MPLINYNKPGPGVAKNSGYEINRFALYFQLLGRKFWNICLLSLVVTLYTLPYILLSILLFNGLGSIPFFGNAGYHLLYALGFVPFMFYGPVLGAGFKIARDFAREEPVFLWSDFWKAFRTGLGKTVALSCVSYFFLIALTYALPFYFLMPGIGVYVLFPICLLAALAILFMQFYIYTMAVCLNLSVKNILKNALIFSFIRIGQNLLLLLVLALLLAFCAVMLVLTFSYPVVFGLLMILLSCFLPAFFLYTAAFVTHPSLQKYVVEPFYQANPDQTSAVLKQPAGPTDTDKQPPREIPEYVYHNGRMVHRSVLESESLFEDNRRIGLDSDDK